MENHEQPICPACSGPGEPLGGLGQLSWYRCRNCGLDFNQKAETSRPSPVAAAELREMIESGAITPFDYEADDVTGATDCPDGCTVEPDGQCIHGYKSAAVTLEVI